MDDTKIVENMRAVLKATRKGKERKRKRSKKSNNNDVNYLEGNQQQSSNDEEIADLMNKTWKMKSPSEKNQKSPPKNPMKINAFEKLMNTRKHETPNADLTINRSKQKRKNKKHKNKQQLSEIEKLDPESEDNSILDSEFLIRKSHGGSSVVMNDGSVKNSPHANGIQKFFKETPLNIKSNANRINDNQLESLENETRKRTRCNDSVSFSQLFQEERTPKKRRKSKENKCQLDTNESGNDDCNSNQQPSRPRRSCASKIDYTLFQSPEKESHSEKKTKRKRKDLEVDEEFNIDTIEVDENSPVKVSNNVKLAPVFVRKVPKPAEDPAVKEARRNFLFSTELPTNIRATIDKQKQVDDEILSNDLVAFPTISHITQSSFPRSSFNNSTDFNNSRVKFLDSHCCDENCMENDIVNISLKRGQFTYCHSHEFPVIHDNFNYVDEVSHAEISSEDVKNAVRKIKSTSGNFPVNRLFKQLLRKHKNASTSDAEITFRNSLFIDVFRPSKFDEYLIASQPVEELKQFLTTWNDRNNKFNDYDSDSNSRGSFKGMFSNNCVVLSGLNGCGKTSSVYALANDLNYEVIEINAGSRRSGKKLLQDLYEATQSHRVEKRTEDSNSEQLQTNETDKRTIILIEDAEIAFDSDDGFISSIQQLINISKRPVILTTNNRLCPHLQKFIQYNEIIYKSPNKTLATKYLSLLCLTAASTYQYRQINEVEIEQLYTLNEYDLRKTINEIEFFIRSDYNGSSHGAMVKRGNLMEFYESKQQRKKRTFISARKDLSMKSFESSITSSYSLINSIFEKRILANEIGGHEIPYYSKKLMNELSEYIDGYEGFGIGLEDVRIRGSFFDEIVESSSGNICMRAKATDYSPLLRCICRSEKAREMTSRRTSRSHYLRFMMANNKIKNDFFSEQCEVFQQDS